MRRRMLSNSGLKALLILHEDVVAGDVVFYDSSSETMVYYRLGEGELIPESCTPIGVVVIPTSHNVYGNGACGVMSIKAMNCSSASTGSNTEQYMYWGSVTDIGTLSNLNKVPSLGTMSVTPSTSLVGSASYGYLPFDKGDFKTMTGDESPHDSGTTYTANTSTSYVHIPSPYSGDSRNPLYYDTATVTTANCLSDFDGVGNTDKIITQRGTKDYNSWNPTYNTESDYPAASCCDMFYTEGTKQGDWYLPACGELGYMIPRFNAICTSIAALIAAYGSEVGVQLNSYGSYWSSSEYNSSDARRVNTDSGSMYSFSKDYSGSYVRAFLRVGGKEKNYGPILISGGTAADIPASGGSSQASGYTYSQTWGWGDSTTDGGVITEGAEISVTSVDADNLGTTITNRAKVGDSVLTITMNGVTNKVSIPVYQEANRVTKVTSVIDSFSYEITAAAGGATVTPTSSSSCTLTFSSGSTSAGNTATNGYTGGTITSSVSYSGSATGATVNTSSGAVTWDSRETTVGDSRSITVTMTRKYTFTHNSTYGGEVVAGTTTTKTATCTQNANSLTLSSISIAAYLPDDSWLATGSWGAIPAGGAYLGVRGTYHYTYSSGSTSTVDAGNLKSGLTFTTTMAEAWTNGGLHILSRGTSYSTSTRAGTVYWTYNGKTSNTLNFTQAKNVITNVSVVSSPGTLTAASFAAAGATQDITATPASATATLKFSSGSTTTTAYDNTTYGTWTFHGYTGSSNQTYATVNSTNYNKMNITMSNNTTTSARSATITRKEAGFTLTLSSSYNNGATSGKSTGTLCTCTVSQAAGAKSYGSYTGTLSLNSTAALSAGATTRTVTFGKVYRPWTWNGVSGSGGNEYYSGTLYLTIGVNSGSSYCSLNPTSAANSSSSTSTSTLSKSSYGTTIISALTYTIYLRMGSTSGTSVKSISVSTTANNKTTITPGDPSITFSYSTKNAAAGSVNPSISYSQTRTLNYTSGSTSALSAVTSGATVSYSETTAHSAATVNASSGAVTWTANTATSSRSCGVTVTVTLNGKSSTKAATSTQSADAVSSTSWGNVTAGTITNATIAASGGTGKATAGNGSLSYTLTWVSGRTTSGTNSVAPNPSSYSVTASSKGATVSGTTTVGSKAVTWSGSGSKSASGTMYVYLAANALTSCSVSCSISSSTVSRLGGTITVSGSATSTYTSGGKAYPGVSFRISDQNANATISGSEITFPKNSATTAKYAYAQTYCSAEGTTYYSTAYKINLGAKIGDITFTFSRSGYTCTVKASKAPGSTVYWYATGVFIDSSGGEIWDGSALGSFTSTSTTSSGTFTRAKDNNATWSYWGSKNLGTTGNESYDFVTA